MRVLVTGANGFVGAAVCSRLTARGTSVVAAVRNTASVAPAGASPVVVGDLHGNTSWTTALDGVAAIVHLSGRVHVMDDNADTQLEEFRRTNVEGTVALARQAAAAGVRRFVFVSSVKVNGEERDAPYTHLDTPQPRGAYAQSKWEAEQELRRIERETGMEVAIVRPPLVYGPGVRANFLRMMEAVHRRMPFPLGSAHNLRSLVFVGNLADALATCVEHPAAAGQIFLVSDGEDVSTAELLRRIARAMGTPVTVWLTPPSVLRLAGKLSGKEPVVRRLLGSLTVDSSAIRHTLSWTPPFTMQEGLAATAAHYWETHAR